MEEKFNNEELDIVPITDEDVIEENEVMMDSDNEIENLSDEEMETEGGLFEKKAKSYSIKMAGLLGGTSKSAKVFPSNSTDRKVKGPYGSVYATGVYNKYFKHKISGRSVKVSCSLASKVVDLSVIKSYTVTLYYYYKEDKKKYKGTISVQIT